MNIVCMKSFDLMWNIFKITKNTWPFDMFRYRSMRFLRTNPISMPFSILYHINHIHLKADHRMQIIFKSCYHFWSSFRTSVWVRKGQVLSLTNSHYEKHQTTLFQQIKTIEEKVGTYGIYYMFCSELLEFNSFFEDF